MMAFPFRTRPRQIPMEPRLPSVTRLEAPPAPPPPLPGAGKVPGRSSVPDIPAPGNEPRYVVVITDSDGRRQLTHTTLMHYREALAEQDEWRRRHSHADVMEIH